MPNGIINKDMPETLDTLSIQISSNVGRATSNIKKLSAALGELKKNSDAFSRLANGSQSAARATGGTTTQGGTAQMSEDAHKTVSSLSKLKDMFGKLKASINAKAIGNPFKEANIGSNELWRSLKRIAMYRFLRTVIKGISAAGREGIQNLYQWSKAFEGAAYSNRTFAQVMDRGAESILYLKNAMGTALASVISVFEPLLYSLADAVVAAVNAFNNLWAVLNGNNSYNKAIRKTTEFAKETGKAAKAVQNLLFGFDELNIIPAQGGAGGAAGTDYSGMFEEAAAVETALSKTIDEINEKLKLTELWGDIKINFKNFSTGFGFNGETLAKIVIAGLIGLVSHVAGFLLGGKLGGLVGTILGVKLGLEATSAIFNNDSKLDGNELKKSLLVVLGGVAGFTWLSGLGGGWGWLGATVGASLAIALISGKFDQTLSKIGLGALSESLKIVLGAATGAAIGWSLAGAPGALFGATAGAILTLFLKDNGKGTFEDKGMQGFTAVKKIVEILEAAFMGFIFFAIPGGGLLAATIAFTLTLSVLELDWRSIKDSIVDAFSRAKEWFSLQYRNFLHWIKGEQQEQAIVNVATGKITYHQKGSAYQSEWFNPKMPIEGSFASGGTPNMGSLFLAGEAGPEFVGNVGGQTQVYNEDQLANTLASSNEGLINTILAAANALIGAIEDKDLNVSIGDRDIAESARRGARLNGRAMVV